MKSGQHIIPTLRLDFSVKREAECSQHGGGLSSGFSHGSGIPRDVHGDSGFKF